MRPLARPTLNLRFNAGFYGSLAVVALAVLVAFGASLSVALPTAGAILLLWMLTVRWMRLGPAEPQMQAATPAPQDAQFLSTRQQLGWLAGVSLLVVVPLLAALLGGTGWLFHRVGERMDAEISFGWWFAGMVAAMFAGIAFQSFLMARWTEKWERERGVRLYTELWPLPKRPVAKGQTAWRRSRYYKTKTGEPTSKVMQGPAQDAPDPLSPFAIVLGSVASGVCALGVSGALGDSALANAFRVVAGLGWVLLGVALLQDWHALRTRLAPRKGPQPFKIFGGLALFVGGGAIVTGIAQLLVGV